MARAYGTDLRKRVVDAIESGLSTRTAARNFSVGISTAGSWHRTWCKTGSYEAQRQGGRNGSVLDAHEAFILGLIEENADVTLAEMADALTEARSLSVDPSTIWHFLKRRGMTYKKRRRTPASRNART